MRSWTPPESFEEYRLLQAIGRGGMGQVYLAHDVLLDRRVAVKFIAAVQPGVTDRQRFLIEARAIARLQHPNVVAIHRIGEVDGRQYIISEFVQGKSLNQLSRPLPWERVLQIGIGLSRGLAAAHRQGVLHRDIKPGNAILTADGEVKLLDFGLAKLAPSPGPGPLDHPQGDDLAPQEAKEASEQPEAGEAAGPLLFPPLTRMGLAVGTPLYMAPEVLDGEPASRRSDIYSLGAVLYELCTGQVPYKGAGPFEDASTTERAAGEKDGAAGTLPLSLAAPGIDPRFAALIERCLLPEPELRFASGDEVRDALEQLSPEVHAAPIPEGNPYRGLGAFEAEHRALFFGRGTEIRAILDRLRTEPLLLVAGDSGVGKSSLCRAGVLPLCAEGRLEEGRPYTVARLMPGKRPLQALCAELARVLGVSEDVLTVMARAEPGALPRLLRKAGARRGGQGTSTLIFIDQMEELVTLSEPAEAAIFGEILGELALRAPGVGVRVLGTVRGDFLGRLAAIKGLGDEIARALYLLRPMSLPDTRDAIIGPARSKGVRFESEELIRTLAESSTGAAGGLPLLQFALLELWEARDQARHLIPASALQALGGVAGALARHADGVLQGLLPEQRESARRVLLKLVNPDGTRTRRTEAELGAAMPAPGSRSLEGSSGAGPGPRAAPRAALDALVRGRLLVARGAEGETVYEVAHEALVQGWGTLRGWLDADADRHAVLRRIEHAASEWERMGRAREALWSERQLREADLVGREELLPGQAAFLAASRLLHRRRRGLRLAVLLGVPALLGAVYGGLRMKARHDLRVASAAHVAQAQGALGRARGGAARVEELRRQALGLFDDPLAEREAAERLLSDAERIDGQVEDAYAEASQELETALLLYPLGPIEDPSRGLLAEVTYERILRARSPGQRGELLRRLSTYDPERRYQRQLLLPAHLSVATRPPSAHVEIQRFEEAEGRRRLAPALPSFRAPVADVALGEGSYLLTFTAEGRARVRCPIRLARAERRQITLDLPPASAVPPGYAYVPPGSFLFGSADDQDLRRSFLGAPPLHEVKTPAYLIGTHEVTFADWLEFLRALPEAERARRTPHARSLRGALDLRELPGPGDAWELILQPTTQVYRARAGEPIRYGSRQRRQVQDWLRFPVSAISWEDAQAYVSWLGRSGRLPGARLCDEHEWERGARGADDRIFPHGDRLAPDDANHDQTYGRQPRGFGPDEVGSHPASESPFGLFDMAGNVWEWTRSVRGTEQAVIRGGAWYVDELSNRSTNREVAEPTLRDILIGMRVCAPGGPP